MFATDTEYFLIKYRYFWFNRTIPKKYRAKALSSRSQFNKFIKYENKKNKLVRSLITTMREVSKKAMETPPISFKHYKYSDIIQRLDRPVVTPSMLSQYAHYIKNK